MSKITTRMFWPILGITTIGFYGFYDYLQTKEDQLKRQQEISWLVQLSAEDDPLLRISAVGRMAKERPVVQEIRLALIKALMDKEPEVRVSAARALGAIGSLAADSAVAALENSLDDPDSMVRQEVAAALERITGKKYADNSYSRPLDQNL